MGFHHGQPLGTGGQWAIPWGFENNVVAYNKAYLRPARDQKLPDRFDDFIQLAVDLTDRSENRYGIATRGSKSWATIHPGFMTQYTREGAVDYTFNGSELVAEMDSDKADRVHPEVDRHAAPGGADVLDRLRVSQCHRRSR